jgi:hypothetical protein
MVGPSAGHPRLLLRPVEPRDADALIAIHRTPEVSAWWGSMDEGFPFGDDPTTTRLTIEVDGAAAAWAARRSSCSSTGWSASAATIG